ncbi:uncharacterized protein LOC143021508 [Oratosquilla oratoria]|uniref:uncharacterized protein LOC143021508 n=1 Tax=Oratosquilla oratoria TaxID=337810 RepID=UPI003F771466
MTTVTSEHNGAASASASSRVKRTHSGAVANGSSPTSPVNSKQPRQEQKPKSRAKKSCCARYHLNSAWSVWYSVGTVLFCSFLVYRGVQRFVSYAGLQWPQDQQPYVELNAYVGLVGASVVVLPFLLVAGIMKVGNLANDGYKLGTNLSTCTRDPPPVLEATTGVIRNLWLHGVPTTPFLHLIAAFCLLMPRLIMDATLVSSGLLPRDEIWKTDLDFLIPFNDRLFVMGMNTSVTAPPPNFPNMFPVNKENSLIIPKGLKDPLEYEETTTMSTKDVEDLVLLKGYSSSIKKRNEDDFQIVWNGRRGGGGDYMTSTTGDDWSPIAPEMINYALALFVFAVRYPAVFWTTNKSFGLLFSLQMMVNGVYTILIISAFSILYKLHVCGGVRELHGTEPFLLNLPATVGLFVASITIITVSSSAVYLYGYQKFNRFLRKSRQRFHITCVEEPNGVRPYAAHCAALVTLIALGVCCGPLLWDLALVYRGSLDAVVLAAVIGTIAHIFSWIVLWLFLTVKSEWLFKLRITVARACVSAARSIKLVNDVELNGAAEGSSAPLLVVGGGKAYAITNTSHRKTIMSVVQKTHEDKRTRGEEEDIYWLRPSRTHGQAHGQTAPAAAAASTASQDRHRHQPTSPRNKVTFDESGILTSPKKSRNASKSPKPKKSTYQRAATLSDSDDEAGDYALLREEPMQIHHLQENQGRQEPPEEDPRYVDRQQMLSYRRAIEERAAATSSPNPAGTTAADYEETDRLDHANATALGGQHHDAHGPMTPPSTRSNDSGMPHEEPRSQRSDSMSTSASTSSNTPPENSERSGHSEESGIHSGATDISSRNRSNSVDDLTQLPPDPNLLLLQPRSMSLQRPPSCTPSQPQIQPQILPHQMHPLQQQSQGGNSGTYGYCRLPGSTSPAQIIYPAAESTLVIRRQRNLTQEIKPPVDPIYGTRPLTSFTDPSNTDAKKKNTNEELMVEQQNTFNSSQSSGSSGYHSGSVNGSSASNSSSNSPVPPTIVAAPQTAQSIYGQKIAHGHNGIYGQTSQGAPRIIAQGPHSPYGRTTSSSGIYGHSKLPQAPQIPLPPIPQGSVPPPLELQHDIYGRTGVGHGVYGHLNDPSTSIYGHSRGLPVGRSSSLRMTSGAVPKYNRHNTLPHLLPRESNYNTNV